MSSLAVKAPHSAGHVKRSQAVRRSGGRELQEDLGQVLRMIGWAERNSAWIPGLVESPGPVAHPS